MDRVGHHDTTALSTHLQRGCPAVRAGGYSQLLLGLAAAREAAWTSACFSTIIQLKSGGGKYNVFWVTIAKRQRLGTAVVARPETTPCG